MFASVDDQVGTAVSLLHVLHSGSERSQMKVLVTVTVVLHLHTTYVSIHTFTVRSSSDIPLFLP